MIKPQKNQNPLFVPDSVFSRILGGNKGGRVRNRRKLLDEVFRDIPDGVLVMDLEGKREITNPAFHRITGLSERATVDDIRKFFGKNYIVPMSHVEVKEKTLFFERHFQNSLGEKVSVAISHFFLYDDEGNIKHIVFLFRSLELASESRTEHEKVHWQLDQAALARASDLEKTNETLEAKFDTMQRDLEFLQSRKQLLQDVFENAPVGSHLVGPDGVILEANSAQLQLLGYTRQQFVGHKITDFHADEDAAADILQRLNRGEALHGYEARFKRSDGTMRTVVLDCNVLWREGQFVHARCFMTDITERSWLEEKLLKTRKGLEQDVEDQTRKLRESESHFRSIIENSTDVITIVDDKGVITYESPSLRVGFGYDPQDMIGKNAFSLVHPEDFLNVMQVFRESLATKDAVRYSEFRYLHENGTWRNIECVSRNLLGNPIVKGVVWNLRDVTERRVAEKVQRENAEQLEKAKTDFISTATHELRTPLTALQGYLSLLEKERDQFKGKETAYIGKIWRATKKLHVIVEDLLSVLRIEERKEPEIKEFSMQDLIREITAEFQTRVMQEKKILLINVSDDCMVSADHEATKKILSNLVDNAIKYTPAGGQIEVFCYREKRAAERGDIIIQVKDNGVGISKKYQGKLFAKFSRVPNPLSVKAGGTGLGLYIVKQLVEMQGGDISVESEEGRGTVFAFTLPAAALKI